MSNFNDYSTHSYGRMIADRQRTEPFVQALRRSIGPKTVVLDIGTGTGIFSFLACQMGAARVYAIEPDEAALHVAQLCAKDVPGSERIVWIKGLSTDIDLPEQVDIVIGDLHGTLPFFKGNIDSLRDARKRHLKPGGKMLPSCDTVYAVPAYAPEEYEQLLTPWHTNDYGVDLSAAAPFVANEWRRAQCEPALPEHLLASPKVWGEIDYNTVESPNLDGPLEWEIERAGTLHGLYVWFDGSMGDGLGYSNAPTLPELVYGRAFFPFERAIDVAPGDHVYTRLSARLVKGSYLYRWDSRITAADGTHKAQFEQSTFKSRPHSMEGLRKANATYVPSLNMDGQVMQAALKHMEAGTPLQAIADALAEQFPQRFTAAGQALDEVARVSQKYG